MIHDWLANGECLFPRKSLDKNMFLGLEERRYRRIRKEISPRTKTSPAKALLSKEFRKTAPVCYLICLSQIQQKATHTHTHTHVCYTIVSINSCGLLMASFSCLKLPTPGNLFQQESPNKIVSIPSSVDLWKHNTDTEPLTTQLVGDTW